MREEMATLRRTSAEAVSTSIRLSEQLANANLEVSRSREAVRDLEDMLQTEITKRSEAERLKDIEAERRRAAEQALNGMVSRSPNRPRTGTSQSWRFIFCCLPLPLGQWRHCPQKDKRLRK